MCGICGIFGVDDKNTIKKMNEIMRHRGPDDIGYYFDDKISLGVTRLSIIDLKKGKQPMSNEDGNIWIIFNGEIYNYKNIKIFLEERGHEFKTKSDTEVIIHLYEDYKEKCVNFLRGIFAFAIWDGKKLFIARDRMGIKPLFYIFINKELFLFSSEIKGLLQFEDLKKELNKNFFQEMAVFGYSLNNNTPIQNIYQLSPGAYMILTIKSHKIKSTNKNYFRLEETFSKHKNFSEKDASKCLEDLIKESVHLQMNADVPIGIFISGGIDSTIIASIMSKFSEKQIDTFSFADNNSFIDLKYSKKVAEYLGANHHEIVIDFDNVIDYIPKMVLSSEGMFKATFSSFFLSKEASKFVKVILSGEGSDELFGGYSHYLDLNAYAKSVTQRVNNFDCNKNIRNALKIISSKDVENFFMFFQKEQLINKHLLPLDHDGMSFGVEVRVPYLNEGLVEFANSLPWTMKIKNRKIGKYILKITAKRVSEKPLREIIDREKVGMPSASLNLWRSFENLSNHLISDNYLLRHPFKKYFSRKVDVLWYELFNHIFIENNCKVDRKFNVFEMY